MSRVTNEEIDGLINLNNEEIVKRALDGQREALEFYDRALEKMRSMQRKLARVPKMKKIENLMQDTIMDIERVRFAYIEGCDGFKRWVDAAKKKQVWAAMPIAPPHDETAPIEHAKIETMHFDIPNKE